MQIVTKIEDTNIVMLNASTNEEILSPDYISSPKLQKMVDRHCTLEDDHVAVVDNFDVMLNQVNNDTSISKFYRIPLLQRQKGSETSYYVWTLGTHWMRWKRLLVRTLFISKGSGENV